MSKGDVCGTYDGFERNMKYTSLDIFKKHFSKEEIRSLIELYLSPNSARGVDGTNYDRFMENVDREVDIISTKAMSAEYRFSPYRQKLIIKSADSFPRKISIPTIRDRITLRALNNFLVEMFSNARPQHSHPIISAAIKSANAALSSDVFVKLDIQSFYDEINHKILLRTLRGRIRFAEPIALVRAAITTPTGTRIIDKSHNEIGVPQGLSVSNILASIYLNSVDVKYENMLLVKYNRYVDDILCISSHSESENIAKSISMDLRRKKKLKVHPLGSGKSQIVGVSEGVEYLGYYLRGPLISVRKSSEKKMLSSLMRILHGTNKDNLERNIWRLNLRIAGCRYNGNNVGWIFYFSQINDVRLLSRIDAQVKKVLKYKNLMYAYVKCRRLVKAYYEVRYNRHDSKYFFNFDEFDREGMIIILKKINTRNVHNIDDRSDSEIAKLFHRLIKREVLDMEVDTMGSFS